MTSKRTAILEKFESEQHLYSLFAGNTAALVEKILSASRIAVHSVTWRCKERESLAKKLEKPTNSYGELADITDIAGIRITTYFAEDVDRVAEIVKSEFIVDELNSIDKRATLDPDRFGYQSLHYVISMSDSRTILIENSSFKHLKAEVQIRSILQHAWAEIEHDLGYKTSSGVPREIRRKFARVAGLLELADSEFGSIREQLAQYSRSVVSDIQDRNPDIELNLPSLQALYKIDSHIRRLDPIVAEIMGRTLVDNIENVRETYIERLAKFGVAKVNELEDIAKREEETVKKFANYWLAHPKDSSISDCEPKSTVSSGLGLFYLLYVLAFRTRNRAIVKEYLEVNNIGPDDPNILADRILAFDPSSS